MMVSTYDIVTPSEVQYQLVPPDGGWGHLITVSVGVMNFVTIVPAVTFGLLYGRFLAAIGDETTGTALSNGVFNTIQSFAGLVAYGLLQKYTYRKVGFLGATFYFAGAILTIFITNLAHVIISYGILQGFGFGLMLPASLSAFNCYFDKNSTLMLSISQIVLTLGAMIFPPIVAFLVVNFGFRGALVFLAFLALLNFPAMAVLEPVERHMKKVPLEVKINNELLLNKMDQKPKSLCEEVLRAQIEPLLSKKLEESNLENSVNLNIKDTDLKGLKYVPISRRKCSIVSLGNKAVSLTTVNRAMNENGKHSHWLDLSLLKDLKYLNISFGISLSYTSDVSFNSMIPLILNNVGLETNDIALMMMVYFGSDLVSRILFSVVSAVCQIRNRYAFLVGSLLSAVFRTAFVLNDTYMWKIITLGTLGFLRCLIQTPLALVISEEYNNNFPKAFSLFMVVCGFINFIFGPLMSFVKSVTKSDVMVVHLLTVAYLLCGLCWIIELLWCKYKGKNSSV